MPASAVALGLLPFLDNFAHLFGCISGLLLGIGLIMHPDHRKGGIRFRQVAIGILALGAWAFLFVVGIVWLRYNVNANALCPYCRYISCVPAPWWTCSTLSPATGACIAVVESGGGGGGGGNGTLLLR
jgi:hypothetical protein